MRILVDYKESERDSLSLKIDSAKYLSDFVIRIQFSNGVEKLVDFKSFLSNSGHPSIRKYLDESKFSSFIIEDGNLNWNDYDLIFPIWDLYKGKIES